MADQPVFSEELREIVESFVIETRESFEELDNDLLGLEDNVQDKALIDKIFRAVHTVKGTSGFLSLEQIALVAHQFEDVLNKLRKGDLVLQPGMMDVMFEAFDKMKVLLQQVADEKLVEIDLAQVLTDLKNISEGTFSAEPAPAPDHQANAQETLSTGSPKSETTSPEAKPLAAPAPEAEAFMLGHRIKDHPAFSDDLREIAESFVIETRESFDELDNDLLELEDNVQDKELIDKIFRAVHTVKGTSGFLSLDQISLLANHFEDVLNKLRKGDLILKAGMIDVMFEAFDKMKVLLQQVADEQLVVIDIRHSIGQLQAISDGTFSAEDLAAAPNPIIMAADVAPANVAHKNSDPVGDPRAEDNITVAPNAKSAQPAERRGTKRQERNTETIRVEVGRLDALMDLVGELVLGRNRLMQIVSNLDTTEDNHDLLHELMETSSQVDSISTELQGAVMHTRMVQIGRVFNKFPRVVRDLTKEFNKEVDLIIEGQETEVDKSLIEEISDPLVHLIRNASDHGIETPEVRQRRGKSGRGTIRLTAAHEGNHIVIRIEDDGAGIDPEKIKRVAISKGVLTAKDAADMPDKNVLDLLFAPGFSTAKKVSKISGRGVGLDVVKTNITRLNGTIQIDSEFGKGSCFTLKLPLTLAIIQGLLVNLNEETFAVPLRSIIEVVRLNEGDIQTIRGREIIRIREQVLPLLRIGDRLNVAGAHADVHHAYAVIIGIAHHRLGLIVDDLIGQKEIVIKPLGSFLKKTHGIAGSTILGDGRVIMILDVAEIIRMEQFQNREDGALNEAA